MFRVIKAAFGVFQAGQAVANPAAWKNAQLVGTLLTALAALAAAFGFDLGLSSEEAAGGALFITAIANGVLVVITSRKVGIPSKNVPLDKVVDDLVVQLNSASRVQRVSAPAGVKKGHDFDFPTERNG